MVSLKRFIFVILLLSLIFTVFTLKTYATNINMNLTQEQNVTSRENSINDISNSSTENNEVSNSINEYLNTNTAATVQTVQQFEDTTSSFDISSVVLI